MGKQFTRRFTPTRPHVDLWFVIIGTDCERTEEVEARVPDEAFIRRLLRIPVEVPILIGRR